MTYKPTVEGKSHDAQLSEVNKRDLFRFSIVCADFVPLKMLKPR